ncbi:uncharacterized protein SRS1_15931 [Sporisorium reilianum f. sp. reilianum]|uniref:HypA-like protein n=1 Tax=Sporisorium reilianum f. sp. reilianum TaxID=72559 RepID=A0A2N8UK18_9BASI|nr:uncharacterized protein SRS1_15931 [Sporisorium reilianum f. sp. reilianum]
MSSTHTPAPQPLDPLACTTSAFPELSPYILASSASTLRTLLSANHTTHHCFFNTRGMHNHALHQLVATLTLSASRAQLEQHYAYQIAHYLGSFALNNRTLYDPHLPGGSSSIQKVDEGNWTQHVGNARFYWAYLHFFDAQVAALGLQGVLEKYVFSAEANADGVQMVTRFYGGVLHALIHFGYALEMGVGEVAAEALAMAASTAASHAWLFEYTWLTTAPQPGEKTGLLQLVREMQQDPRLSVDALRLRDEDASLPNTPFTSRSSAGHGVIQGYIDRWDAQHALPDLALLSALLLGAVPLHPNGAYKHDFFLMHLNNAHLFTPLFLAHLSPSRAHTFLRALAAQFAYFYICRGRPAFSLPTHAEALSWEQMFSDARANVDEHLPKAVRALYVFERRYAESQARLAEAGLLDEGVGEGEVCGSGPQRSWFGCIAGSCSPAGMRRTSRGARARVWARIRSFGRSSRSFDLLSHSCTAQW